MTFKIAFYKTEKKKSINKINLQKLQKYEKWSTIESIQSVHFERYIGTYTWISTNKCWRKKKIKNIFKRSLQSLDTKYELFSIGTIKIYMRKPNRYFMNSLSSMALLSNVQKWNIFILTCWIKQNLLKRERWP